MEIIKVSAARRPESGKGPSARLRREGKIPAIAYGRDLAATRLAVSPKDLLQVLGSEHGQNAVLELALDSGEKVTAMVRAYSYHPITRDLLHADFISVKMDQPIDVDVPFKCTGKSKGVIQGGILQQVYRRLPIRCLPADIPAFLEVDITELDVGDSLKLNQIKIPEGVKVRLPEDQTVVVIAAPEKAGEEEAKPGTPGAPGAPGFASSSPPFSGAATTTTV